MNPRAHRAKSSLEDIVCRVRSSDVVELQQTRGVSVFSEPGSENTEPVFAPGAEAAFLEGGVQRHVTTLALTHTDGGKVQANMSGEGERGWGVFQGRYVHDGGEPGVGRVTPPSPSSENE